MESYVYTYAYKEVTKVVDKAGYVHPATLHMHPRVACNQQYVHTCIIMYYTRPILTMQIYSKYMLTKKLTTPHRGICHVQPRLCSRSKWACTLLAVAAWRPRKGVCHVQPATLHMAVLHPRVGCNPQYAAHRCVNVGLFICRKTMGYIPM